VPATLFVTAGKLGDAFWWDELERLILDTPALPPQLQFRPGGREMRWRQDGATPADRRHLLARLYRFLLAAPEGPEEGVAHLRQWAGAIGRGAPPILTEQELAILATDGPVTIGAHGWSHRPLARLPTATVAREVQQSKLTLEAITGRPVRAFSYPHGSASIVTRRLVAESGYVLACATHNDVLSHRSDAYVLPRFWPANVDGATFGRWLRRWL
jgi:peptidoglycan/xylan/chitin deacetylase (PgdA/CDA1 family)